MANPKITIITAVYNSQKTVGEAIQSVARQKYPHVEHLVIEGMSSDGSLRAIDSATHDRMFLYSEPDNGIYDALNKGITRSTGAIIGFVHSDDFLAHENVLSQIASAFADDKTEAVFSDLDYISRKNSLEVLRHWSAGPYSGSRLKRGWMPPHPTLYLRREAYDRVGMFDTSLAIAADYDFILRYFSQTTAHCAYIPEVLYKMRTGGTSNRNLTRIAQKMVEDHRAIRRNRIGGVYTLACKNFSKIPQLFGNK